MEYLQQAQERLKQQSGSAGSGVHRPADQSVTQSPPLIYSSTKAISLSKQLMRDHRLITGYEGGAFVDSYKRLRAQVMQQFRQKGWNVLGVSSPTAHEGKTLTAVNLSLALAMDLAHTVLLVDADMHRPAVHRLFGMDQVQGLTDYLFDAVPLPQLLIHPGIGRLVFLPGGRSIKNSAEALASPRMAALAQELKHRYPSRFIVLDLPPILSRADVLGFSPHIDALLLVIEEGRTSSVEVEQAVAAIAGTVPILGGILNKSGRQQLTRRRAMELLPTHST
ncbi:MAG: exopolysaccharide biosynthesis protein [Nitrospira sp. WS110]|nr:exopolysaccharide biosynthesis protein [Nitrospira sp. WS110]